MENIYYVRFSPEKDEHPFQALINCYQEVFADEPWNEWKYCVCCGKSWGLLHHGFLEQINFEHCGQPIVDFWPSEKIKEDVLHEITGKASCWLVLDHKQVVGFCWGYPIDIKELEEKLELEGFAEKFKVSFSGHNVVTYIDEVGVKKEYRNKKLAKQMVTRMCNDLKRAGIRVAVVRTKKNPSTVLYDWFTRDGYKIIASYGEEDGRVILAHYL